MSDRLTAAGEALLKGISEDMQLNRADRASLSEYFARVEAEAEQRALANRDLLDGLLTARAVDEALSVERVADALAALSTSPSGVTFAPAVFAHRSPAVMEWAAALVAHLRGPR